MAGKKNEKKSGGIWMVFLILSLIGIVIILGGIVFRLYQDMQAQKEYEALQAQLQMQQEQEEEENTDTISGSYDPEGIATEEEINSLEFTGTREGEAARLPDGIFSGAGDLVDFAKLEEINPDLYAWVRIPDTAIDYPVAQYGGEDDSFYLNHDMYGNWRFAGCIYSEKLNKKDFSDPLTVLYGHNMINGSMFAGLMKFADQEYFDAHPYIYVYTKDKVYAYEIFTFYTFDNRHLLYAFDFSKKKEFKKYLEEMEEVHSWDLKRREDVEVTTDDKLLALETCVGNATDNRYLLHAKLVWSGSNEEYLEYIGAEEN